MVVFSHAIGVMLVLTGVLYFVLFGRWVLPAQRERGEDASSARSMQAYVEATYGLRADMFEIRVPEGSIIIGQTLADLMVRHNMYILGTSYRGHKVIAPMADTKIEAPARLAVLGLRRVVEHQFAEPYGLEILPQLDVFADDFAARLRNYGSGRGCYSSRFCSDRQTPIDLRLRQTHGLSLLAIQRGEETLSHVETEDHSARISGKFLCKPATRVWCMCSGTV